VARVLESLEDVEMILSAVYTPETLGSAHRLLTLAERLLIVLVPREAD
jgi:hypothetical protein